MRFANTGKQFAPTRSFRNHEGRIVTGIVFPASACREPSAARRSWWMNGRSARTNRRKFVLTVNATNTVEDHAVQNGDHWWMAQTTNCCARLVWGRANVSERLAQRIRRECRCANGGRGGCRRRKNCQPLNGTRAPDQFKKKKKTPQRNTKAT